MPGPKDEKRDAQRKAIRDVMKGKKKKVAPTVDIAVARSAKQ